MYQLFIIGALMCFLAPYFTLGVCIVILYLQYRLGGSKRVEELQAAALAYIAKISFLNRLVTLIAPTYGATTPTLEDPIPGYNQHPVLTGVYQPTSNGIPVF